MNSVVGWEKHTVNGIQRRIDDATAGEILFAADATGENVVFIEAGKRHGLESHVAITVEDVLAIPVVVRAVGLFHGLGTGQFVDGQDVFIGAGGAGVHVGGDREFGVHSTGPNKPSFDGRIVWIRVLQAVAQIAPNPVQ